MKHHLYGDVLPLTLTKKWFKMIACGEKKEEYREIKPYWTTRLKGKEFDTVYFKNGYSKNVPEMYVECKGIHIAYIGESKWGWSETCYVIELGAILEINGQKKNKHG